MSHGSEGRDTLLTFVPESDESRSPGYDEIFKGSALLFERLLYAYSWLPAVDKMQLNLTIMLFGLYCLVTYIFVTILCMISYEILSITTN